ncbi:MAG: hypothetical protein ACUVS4_05480, partial [Chloroflexaceae bacterium]
LARPPARRLKPRASGLPGWPTPPHQATPVACGGGAGGFSPTGRGALHDGMSHPPPNRWLPTRSGSAPRALHRAAWLPRVGGG